jgi:hypothetical protein
MSDVELSALAQYFEVFGQRIYGSDAPQNASPLYAVLSLRVAQDPDILALVAGADLATTVPNLFFGAVHDLLLTRTARWLCRKARLLSHRAGRLQHRRRAGDSPLQLS